MKSYSASSLGQMVKCHGRTFFDTETQALFFNWTCSGFTVAFEGTRLRARILAYEDRLPMPPDAPVDYPCVGVVGEDGETLTCRFKCAQREAWYDLFDGEQGAHTLRMVKLSENMRGKTGLLALETDGELRPVDSRQKGLAIEFIGDSITCGFGNEAPDRDALFETAEENGWMTYGAVAGRKLGAEFNMISVSGIGAGRAKYPRFPGKQMEDVYEYTDLYCHERLGRAPALWDFEHNRKDIVLINLGTNDVGPVRFYQDLAVADEEEAWFSDRYRALLETVRRLNGPEALIVCTLGPLDYYLWDNIKEVVEAYCRETGDRRVACFKLIGVNLLTEGFGAVSHPSLKTQVRMGAELAARLEKLIKQV